MKTDNLTAQEAELLLINGYKVQPMINWQKDEYVHLFGCQLMVKTILNGNSINHHQSIIEWFQNYSTDQLYRLVTTDEDVAKWYENVQSDWTWNDLDSGIKAHWRKQYAAHLTTLPELTEGETETCEFKQPDKIWVGASFDELKEVGVLKLTDEGFKKEVPNPEAPQAYKFPYTKTFIFEDKLLGLDLSDKLHTICYEILENEMDVHKYICEAINEKLNRK